VLHGITGTPQSMRGVALELAAAGFAVELPLLPGHGTSVEDMATTAWADWSAAAEAAYQELAARSDLVVVVGLSMGGTLTAWLAGRHPEIVGIVEINGQIEPTPPALRDILNQMVAQGLTEVAAIGSDIAEPGQTELAYEALPISCAVSLADALEELQAHLPDIRCPVLILSSPNDHIVPPSSSVTLAAQVSGPVEFVTLADSYHVATLDFDRRLIEQRTVAFALRVTEEAEAPGPG